MKKHLKSAYLSAGLLTVIAYVFFKPFYNMEGWPPYTSEIMAAILGAIFTALITSVLLEKQSEAEEKKEKNIGVYNKKFEVYSKFVSIYNEIPKEREDICQSHIKSLIACACDVYLVATKEDTIKEINSFLFFVKTTNVFYEDQLRYENDEGHVVDEIRKWVIAYNNINNDKISLNEKQIAMLYDFYEKDPLHRSTNISKELDEANKELVKSIPGIGTMIGQFRLDLADDSPDVIDISSLEKIDNYVM